MNEIVALKERVVSYLGKMVNERGMDRVDIARMGALADVIKDLAEAEEKCSKAEYYQTVTMQMGGGSTRSPDSFVAGTGPQGDYGYSQADHDDMVSAIRDMIATADQGTKARIRRELPGLLR